jgi:ribosome-associated protein
MNTKLIIKELKFKAVRSSGAGGQHVNKVSSKIELTFDLQNSESFTEDEKELLIQKLKNKLTKDNILLLQCDESRSQH